ncbi:MAG: hypothetical protein JSS82_06535 [Bacteroidetes bacterium]|nr:hypothetical protein [Bacteroidota bacterium]
MNSAFANLFLLLQQRILDQVPGIVYIDQDLGQLRPNPDDTFPVSFPCLLIDLDYFTFKDLSENVQTATGTIVFKLGFSTYSSSNQAASEETKEAALAFYNLEWELHKALQGWDPGDSFGHLNRTTTTSQHRSDALRVRELRYTISFDDYSTKNEVFTAPAELDVDPQVITI